MSRIGVITNPLSQRNKDQGRSMAEALARHPELIVAELPSVLELPQVLEKLAKRQVEVICIDGGDGTVIAALRELLYAGIFPQPPKLALLPGGMTNLIARDVGLHGDRGDSIERLIDADRRNALGAALIARPVIELRIGERSADAGMFFGAAAAYGATMLSRQKFHPLGAKQSVATGAGVLGGLLSAFFNRGEGSLHQGNAIEITIDGRPLPGERRFLLLATTLDRLILGLWPFWEEGEGPLRYFCIDAPPRRLARGLPNLFTGKATEQLRQAGWRSGRAHEIRLRLASPMLLDGEIRHAAAAEDVVLTAGRRLSFVQV